MLVSLLRWRVAPGRGDLISIFCAVATAAAMVVRRRNFILQVVFGLRWDVFGRKDIQNLNWLVSQK